MSGVPQVTISAFLRGKGLRLANAARLCEALGLELVKRGRAAALARASRRPAQWSDAQKYPTKGEFRTLQTLPEEPEKAGSPDDRGDRAAPAQKPETVFPGYARSIQSAVAVLTPQPFQTPVRVAGAICSCQDCIAAGRCRASGNRAVCDGNRTGPGIHSTADPQRGPCTTDGRLAAQVPRRSRATREIQRG